jgi:flagellar biosynthesis component FlhA
VKLRDLLPPTVRGRVYQVLALVNAVLGILAVVPGVPFDVPTVIAAVAAIAGAAGFTLAAGNTPTAGPEE